MTAPITKTKPATKPEGTTMADTKTAEIKTTVKPDKQQVIRRTTTGAWVVYAQLNDPSQVIAISVHADELDSRRAAMKAPQRSVVFVPWEQTIEDAVKAAQ
jgi:hypothetical protein